MKRTTKYFITIELILYILFLTLDFTKHYTFSTPFKYISIILCFIFSIYSSYHHGDKLIPVALFFTMIADWFLLIIDKYYILGLICFFIVQMIYMIRLMHQNQKNLWELRLLLPIVIIIILYITHMFNTINVLSVIYFSQLLINTIIAWMDSRNIGLTFAIGLTLFVCCDICVGLFNISNVVIIYELTRIGMWLFYLPSQVFITMSGLSH